MSAAAAHSSAPDREADPDAIQAMRVDLAAAYRLIHRLGLDDSIYTHISARLPGEGHRFLINPYGMRFEEVTPQNLVTVDIDGRVLEDPMGLGINPAGFTIHSAIHAARHAHGRGGGGLVPGGGAARPKPVVDAVRRPARLSRL